MHAGRIEKARAAGIEDDVLTRWWESYPRSTPGSSRPPREAFRLADATSSEACGALCSPKTNVAR